MTKTALSFFAFLLLFSFSSLGQEGIYYSETGNALSEAELKSILPDSFNLFGPDEALTITIASDFKNLVRRKFKDEYQPATLHYHLNDSILVKKEILIKPRGEFRKKYCHFPPIKINFKKTGFLTPGLEGLEKMKMVTHCKRSKTYESYILKEYLTYKLFSLLTDKSFKSRLLEVRYIDTGRDNKILNSVAFIIEDAKKMAFRHNAVVLKQDKLSQPQIEDQSMTLVAIFEYMIGNTDWSVPNQHNLKLIKILELDEPDPYPVPYDFDYSGIVDTDYAIPTEGLGIQNVRERIFQGYCKTEEAYQKVLDIFLEKEQAMYDLVNEFSYLDNKSKKDYLSYLEEFFQKAKNPKSIYFLLNNTCKN